MQDRRRPPTSAERGPGAKARDKAPLEKVGVSYGGAERLAIVEPVPCTPEHQRHSEHSGNHPFPFPFPFPIRVSGDEANIQHWRQSR